MKTHLICIFLVFLFVFFVNFCKIPSTLRWKPDSWLTISSTSLPLQSPSPTPPPPATPFSHNGASPLCPVPSLLFSFASHFLSPLSFATTHQGPGEGKWKVWVLRCGAVWQQGGKLLFYGFIYGSVSFFSTSHMRWEQRRMEEQPDLNPC